MPLVVVAHAAVTVAPGLLQVLLRQPIKQKVSLVLRDSCVKRSFGDPSCPSVLLAAEHVFPIISIAGASDSVLSVHHHGHVYPACARLSRLGHDQ